MKKKLTFSLINMLVFMTLISCSAKPGDIMKNNFFSEPAQYDEPSNADKLFPLFVYLHGSGASSAEGALPCFKSAEEKLLYPSFIFAPFTKNLFDNAQIISQIESYKKQYRIDPDRIYLMGYSLGGSGSYSLANAYYKSKGQLFAAIVRMAGQSQTTLEDAIVGKTSVWYHVGLADSPLRVQTARDSYSFLKNHPDNKSASGISGPVPLMEYPGTTWTLLKDGIEIVKYTEYNAPVGHGISDFPLQDPNLMKWIFGQSLKKR